MFRALAKWIESTPVSQAFQNALWVIPTSQSIHLVAIGIVFGSATILALRLLGLTRSQRSVAEVTNAVAPWIWSGLGVLLLTGIVQTVAEPGRQLNTPHFRWKMVMVVAVSALTWIFFRTVRRRSVGADMPASPAMNRLFAIGSLALWIGIIVCGREIAYVWERYE